MEFTSLGRKLGEKDWIMQLKNIQYIKEKQTNTVYFCGFYIELNVLILYLKTGDRKFVFSEMM